MKKIIACSLMIFSCSIPYDMETRIIFETSLTDSNNNSLKNIPYSIIVSTLDRYESDEISSGNSNQNGAIKSIFPEPDLTDYSIDLNIKPVDYLPVSILNFNRINLFDYKISYPKIKLYKEEELVDLNIDIVQNSSNKEIRKIEFLGNKYEPTIYLNWEESQYYISNPTVIKVLKNQMNEVKYTVYNYSTNAIEENFVAVTINEANTSITITF